MIPPVARASFGVGGGLFVVSVIQHFTGWKADWQSGAFLALGIIFGAWAYGGKK